MWIPVTETLINSTHFKMNTYFMTKNIDIYEKFSGGKFKI